MLHSDGTHLQGSAAEMLQRERLEALYGCRLTLCGDGTGAHVVPVI
jgi:hypothetical protein